MNRFFIPLFCLLIIGLVSCEDDTGNQAEVDPPSGVWNYTDGGLQENTCGTDEVYRDSNTFFRLTNNGDGTITIDQDEYGDFDCKITGKSFTCPKRLSSDQEIENFDAVLHYQVSIQGTFATDTQMSGTQRADIECEGTSCAGLATALGFTNPCYYTVNFTAENIL